MATPLNKSVVKSFRLLLLFRSHPEGLTLSEVAEASAMSMATTHRFVKTFEKLGALYVNPQRRILLGSGLEDLGVAMAAGADPLTPLKRLVAELSASLDLTVHAAIRDGGMVRYIAKGETARCMKLSTQVGTELEAYCTALGKVLLSTLSWKDLRAYLDSGGFVALTPNTITDPQQLREELLQVREQAFAFDDEEFREGLRCLAIPLKGASGSIRGALSMSGPALRFGHDARDPLLGRMRQKARLIMRQFPEEEWDRGVLSDVSPSENARALVLA